MPLMVAMSLRFRIGPTVAEPTPFLGAHPVVACHPRFGAGLATAGALLAPDGENDVLRLWTPPMAILALLGAWRPVSWLKTAVLTGLAGYLMAFFTAGGGSFKFCRGF